MGINSFFSDLIQILRNTLILYFKFLQRCFPKFSTLEPFEYFLNNKSIVDCSNNSSFPFMHIATKFYCVLIVNIFRAKCNFKCIQLCTFSRSTRTCNMCLSLYQKAILKIKPSDEKLEKNLSDNGSVLFILVKGKTFQW